MTWFSALPTVLVSAFILLTPGLLIGWLIRMRGLWLWALAPAISATVLSLASVALGWFGIAWTVLNAAVFSVAFGAVVVLVFRVAMRARFAPRSDSAAPSSRSWPAVVGWVVGGGLLGWHTIAGIGSPENVSQTFDNIFHLNLIAWISEFNNASPFAVGTLIAPEGDPSFYPDAWHALVQLAQQATGVSVPLAINAFNVAAAMIIWPLGIMLLTHQVAGKSPSTTIAAGVLSAALPAAPLNMLFYGVLYPYFLALTLAPAVLAVVLNLLGVSRESRMFTVLPLSTLLLGSIPGIALAHPAVLMGVLALSVPAVIVATFAGWRSVAMSARIMRLAGLATFIAAGFGMMYVLRPGDQWGPRFSIVEAAWQTASLSLMEYGTPFLAAALVVVGLVFSLTRRDRTGAASIGMWVMGALLFFVTAGVSIALVRIPTGVWYGDTPRLAALFPVIALPLAAAGAAWIIDAAARKWRRAGSVPSAAIPTAAIPTAALAVLLVVTQLSAGYGAFTERMRASYTATDDSALLSVDEIEMLERLPELVEPDEVIAGSPWTGTALAFAFSDREVVMPHIFMKELSEDRSTVLGELREATPEACTAAANLRVAYVLDFGEREVHGDRHEFPGIEELESSAAFELVEQVGDVKLFRLVGCD